MTARSPTRSASNLLIVMLLLSGVGVTLPAATALAEDCLAAPNSPAREATRWYYRLDRATQHKCWYMRALDRPAQQVAAPAKTALPATAFAIPIPRPRPSTAGSGLALRQADTDPSFSHAEYAIPIPRPRPSAVSLSQDDTGPSAAHAEEIAAKPSVTPPVSESTAETTPSIPKKSTSQQAGTSSAAPADETTSAISEMHRGAPSPETNAEATAPAADAKILVGARTGETSSPTSDAAAPHQAATSSEPDTQATASGADAAPTIIAPTDDAVSSIPKGPAAQLSTPSDLGSNDAETVPDVSLAEHQAPPAVAMLNARPLPADLLSHGRDRTALTDEPTDNAGTRLKPLYLIVAFLVVLVVMSYYVVFRYFVGVSADMSGNHFDDDGVIDDEYNDPEFYRKLRQGVALEKS